MGMEPAGYAPRILKGMGLTFGTSPRGACYLRTTFYKPELPGPYPLRAPHLFKIGFASYTTVV